MSAIYSTLVSLVIHPIGLAIRHPYIRCYWLRTRGHGRGWVYQYACRWPRSLRIREFSGRGARTHDIGGRTHLQPAGTHIRSSI